MPTRSTRLAAGTVVAGQTEQLFLVPPETTVLLKSWYGYSYGSQTGALSINVRSAGLYDAFLRIVADATAGYRWDGWIAAPPGAELELYNGCNGVVTYWLSGTLLPGVVPELPSLRDPAPAEDLDGG